MPRLTNTAPPRLLNSEMIILPKNEHARPLVCVITMDTDDGAIELALNAGVAEQLFVHLADFLDAAKPMD
jgi:hypothetical protein